MKLSVAILTFNEEKNIKDCLESVKWADEIILIDEKSSDKTVDIAKKYTQNITLVDHEVMFHKNKQKALDKCTGNWIFQIDADERVSPELKEEILSVLKSYKSGYQVPRCNKIFGEYLSHTGWYPDYQIKLFQKGKGRFPCKSVHEPIEIDGEIGTLKNNLLHEHYTSVEQFIDRMNRYTTDDVNFMISKDEGKVAWPDAVKFPLDEFLKRFFYWEGYKDGLHGLVLSLLMSFNRLVVFAKLWERQGHPELVSGSILEPFYKEIKKSARDFDYWRMSVEQNPVKKIIYKIKRSSFWPVQNQL